MTAMDRSDIVYLVKNHYETDDIGQQVAKEDLRKVYCNVSSVSGTEWAEAGRIGIKPDFKISMFRYDYQGETALYMNGTRYSVYRTYAAQNEIIELYVEKKAGV